MNPNITRNNDVKSFRVTWFVQVNGTQYEFTLIVPEKMHTEIIKRPRYQTDIPRYF